MSVFAAGVRRVKHVFGKLLLSQNKLKMPCRKCGVDGKILCSRDIRNCCSGARNAIWKWVAALPDKYGNKILENVILDACVAGTYNIVN